MLLPSAYQGTGTTNSSSRQSRLITTVLRSRSWSRSRRSSGVCAAGTQGAMGAHPWARCARVILWAKRRDTPPLLSWELSAQGLRLSATAPSSLLPGPRFKHWTCHKQPPCPQGGGWDQQQPWAITRQSAPEPGWAAAQISPGGRYAKGCDRRASWVTSTHSATCSPQQNSRPSLQCPETVQEQDEGSAVPDKPVLSV